MPKKGQEVDNKYLYAFITVLVILITTVYCISVVSAHNPLPFCAAGETTVQTSENTQAPPSDELAGSKAESECALPAQKERPAIVFPLDGNITSLYAMRLDPFYDPVSGEEPTPSFTMALTSASKSRDILACADGEVVFNGYTRWYIDDRHGSFVRSMPAEFSIARPAIVFAGGSSYGRQHWRSTGPPSFEIRVGGKADPLRMSDAFTGTITEN